MKDYPIRYILDKSTKFIWEREDFDLNSRIGLPCVYSSNEEIFVDILEVKEDKFRVKLYFSTGQIFEGWYLKMISNIKIFNYEKLFDGRFNC